MSAKSATILLAEPSAPVAATLRRFLESAGFTVRVASSVEEAEQRAGEEAPEVLCASVSSAFDGEGLCRRLKALLPATEVVLLYPPDVDDADAHAAAAGADAALVGPLKRGTVVSCVRVLLQGRTLKETVERLEADLQKHIAEPPKDVTDIAGTSADFEFFKKYLLMEVKRSRRYKYPVSFLLVAVDHFAERAAELAQPARKAALAEALSVITRGIRDIDLAVPSGDNRFLVFLPHTPSEGALFVAGRLQQRLRQLTQLSEATASIGVASYEPAPGETQIGFGTLMKAVTDALAKAQAAGGDRIESAGPKQKRTRISLA